jgi:hypothetical protein
MGARTVPLQEVTADNTEVCGLNGRPSVLCGFSPPIVRHRPSGLYCALSVTRTPGLVWNTEEEIRELGAAGRITLLSETMRLTEKTDESSSSSRDEFTLVPEAIRLPRRWKTDTTVVQPVVLWITEKFRYYIPVYLGDHAGTSPPWYVLSAQQSDPVDWGEILYLNCETLDKVEWQLDSWGRDAREMFDEQLSEAFGWWSGVPQRWGQFRQLADAGLCAARDAGLRYWLYVRYCATSYFTSERFAGDEVAPENAYQTFQVLVRPFYPGVTWNRFCEDMFMVARRAQDIARLSALQGVPVSGSTHVEGGKREQA